MSLRTLRTILAIAALSGTALLAVACGGQQPDSLPAIVEKAGGPQLLSAPVPPSPPLEFDEVNSQVTAAAVPEGVSPELWRELTNELLQALAARDGGKLTSTPPDPQQNELTDLEFVYEGEQVVGMEWDYANRGDYNQDGLVSVNDLTPIGQNFGAASGSAGWPEACLADGNRDGVITVNDITPIGQCFGCSLGGYNVYGGPSENGPWTLLGSLAYAEASGDPWLHFYFPLSPADLEFGWIWVVPYDMEGWEPAGGDPALVELGSDMPQVVQQLGPAGGTIYAPPGSPIDGVYIEFPEGALPELADVSLGYNTGQIVPVIGEFLAPLLTLSTGEVTEFAAPVQLNVPFDPELGFPIPYHINDDGTLRLMTITGVDDVNGVLTYATFHASRFGHLYDSRIWGVYRGEPRIWRETCASDTGFSVALDGMALDNDNATHFYTDGICLGMTSFTQWYFKDIRQEHDVSNRLGMFHATDFVSTGSAATVQEVIAVRAHTSASATRQPILNALAEQVFMLHGHVYVVCSHALLTTRQPQLIALYEPWLSGHDGHSILAYKCANGVVYAWDPNYPFTEQRLVFNEDATTFSYSGGNDYGVAYCEGEGSAHYNELSLNIYNDAKLTPPFAGSELATIQIAAPADGYSAPTNQVILQGTIESGFVLVDKLEVLLNGVTYSTDVPPDGDFAIAVPVQEGKNELKFVTRGKIHNPLRVLLEITEVDNNYKNKVFTINGPLSVKKLRVELTYGAAAEPLSGEFGSDFVTPYIEGNLSRVGTWGGFMGWADYRPYVTCEDFTTRNAYDQILDGYEVTTVHQPFPGTYVYSVIGPYDEWAAHAPQVKIYSGSTLLETVTAPTGQPGTAGNVTWHVFNYEGDQDKVSVANTIN
jgi:hypothetical protein